MPKPLVPRDFAATAIDLPDSAMQAATSDMHAAMAQIAEKGRRQANPAIGISESLIESVKTFQDSLSPSQELLISFQGLPENARITIIRRLDAQLIAFEGEDGVGSRIMAIQHCTQISVVMTCVERVEYNAPRIGFI